MSNRKDGFDEFGNPLGKAFDLGGVDDERLKDENILLYVSSSGSEKNYEWHLAQAAVAERNINMDLQFVNRSGKCPLNDKALKGCSQLWVVSDRVRTISNQQLDLICDFVKMGGGILIWADNAPYIQDANFIAKKLVGTKFSGDKPGGKVLKPSKKLIPGSFIEHPLTQGINNLFEGITICTIDPTEHVTILAKSHDGQNCMACYEYKNERAVLDSAFTKLSPGSFYKTAGTARYFRNIAFWLARGTRNVEYKSFTPGRESLATINPGATSERYKYAVTQPINLTYVLHWEGVATLGLAVQDPQGRIVSDLSSSKAPIRLDVTATIPGDWVCFVKGVNIPKVDFPYVLTLVLQKGAPTIPPVKVGSPVVSAPLDTPAKRLPIYILMDGSSRASDFAPNLDLGVRIFADRLRARVSRGAAPSLSLILANEAGQVSVPLKEISGFSLPTLPRRGKCGLGRALANLNASIASNPADGKPLVIILLVGTPDDEWFSEAERLRNLAVQGKANVFVLGVGGYADTAALKRLTNSIPLSLPVLTQVYARQTFDWLYRVADVVLGGLESGVSGQSRSVPPPPACLQEL